MKTIEIYCVQAKNKVSWLAQDGSLGRFVDYYHPVFHIEEAHYFADKKEAQRIAAKYPPDYEVVSCIVVFE